MTNVQLGIGNWELGMRNGVATFDGMDIVYWELGMENVQLGITN